MRRDAFLAICLLAAAAAGAARAAPEAQPAPIDPTRRVLPVEGVITNADWLTKPSANDIATFYPPLATALNIEGLVTIHCTVTAAGLLAECAVTREAPKGLRFGEATLRLASRFRMKPMTVDGTPVSGGQINIPVGYRLPKTPTPAATADAAAPAPSPKAMALAHRLAVITVDNFVTSWQAASDKWKTFLGSLSPEEQAALDAYGQSMASHAPEYADKYAAIYARTYSEAELAGAATFFESPAGKAWAAHQASLAEAAQTLTLSMRETLSADARTKLCQMTACPPPPAAK